MSSPSRSPSPLPPTRYFDLLPTELLRNVFNDLDESPRTRRTEVTLLSLCLTSQLCHSLAQPLLFKRIEVQLIGGGIGNAQDLLKRLTENNLDQALAAVEAIIFNKEKHKNVKKWLAKLVDKATNLREVYVRDEFPALKTFFGSNITKLSLNKITLKLSSAFFFPELVHLSISSCGIHQDEGIQIKLPKLRHLGLLPVPVWQADEFLNQLAPQLVSLTVPFADKARIPSSISRSSSISILFKSAVTNRPTETSLQGVRDFCISSPLGSGAWAKSITNAGQQLETLTVVKHRGGGGRNGIELETPRAVIRSACEEHGIELIIFEPDGPWNSAEFDDLIPVTFIRRAEERYAKLKAPESE